MAGLCSKEVFLPDDFAEVRLPGGERRTRLGDARAWSHATHPVFKGSGDGASFQNAPKDRRFGTSCYLIYLGSGVRKLSELSGLVSRLAHGVHSCLRMIPLVVWMAKDNHSHCKEHLEPRMNDAKNLEKEGMEGDVLSEMPPWDLESGKMNKRALETEPGTKANRRKAGMRAILVTKVKLLPLFMWAFDGCTTFNVGGVGVGSKQNDPFTNELGDDLGSFHEIRVLRKGKTLTDLAEDLAPGCTSKKHRDHWIIDYLLAINKRSKSCELQAVTREPQRQKAKKHMAAGIGRHAKQLSKVLNDPKQKDGRTETQMPFEDPDLERLGYEPKSFVPKIDGGAPNAATIVASEDMLVRVPVMPKHTRQLEKPIWAERQHEELDESVPHLGGFAFGLCVMHCAMRTMESCLKNMLLTLMTQYKVSAKDKAIIDEHLNEHLKKTLRIRPLITMNDHGELNKLQINGQEARTLIADLRTDEEEGGSVLLKAVSDTYAKLTKPPGPSTTKLGQWRIVLTHWALAMSAAYVMRATAEDRDNFRKHARFYAMEKSNICAGICTWYDWQLYSIFPKIFDTYGSLYALCQEGIEGCQKQNNMFLRLGNNFANVGRIPYKVLKAGRDAVRSYMEQRKQNTSSAERHLYMKQLMSFFAEWYDEFTRAEEYKSKGRTADWKTKYTPAWLSFVCISTIYRIIAAKRSWDKAARMPAKVIRWVREETGKEFEVEVHDAHRAALLAEIMEYYKPVDLGKRGERVVPWAELCEKGVKSRRKQIADARRARWKARVRDPKLWRPMEYVTTV